MLVKCDQSLHSSFLWCRFYQVCVTYWELCQVWILVYSSRVYSSLTGVSCLWSKQCKGRRYLERTAATLLCVKCALALICVKCVYSRIWCAHFASRFYSRATVHVATDYTTLSLFWNWSYFLSLPKKTVIPQMKTSPATFLFLCFFFFSFRYRWVLFCLLVNCIKSGWPSLHVVMVSFQWFLFSSFYAENCFGFHITSHWRRTLQTSGEIPWFFLISTTLFSLRCYFL